MTRATTLPSCAPRSTTTPGTEGAEVNARTLELDTAHGPMPLYEARPDAEARGAVIVIQEAFGVNAHIEDVTRRFADAGYHAVAPHLFHRAGGGTAPYGDFSKVLPLYEHLDDAGILVDFDATRAHLNAAGWDAAQLGIVGFCFGGRVTFLVALRQRLGAAGGVFWGGGRGGGVPPVAPRGGPRRWRPGPRRPALRRAAP